MPRERFLQAGCPTMRVVGALKLATWQTKASVRPFAATNSQRHDMVWAALLLAALTILTLFVSVPVLP